MMAVTMGDIYKDSYRAEFRKFGSKNKVRKVLAATFSPLAKNMSKKTKSRIKTAGRAALTVGLGLGVTRLAGSTTSYLANSNVPEMEAELRRNQAARQWARQNPANNSIPSSRPRPSSGR